jgi:hypothetical protein
MRHRSVAAFVSEELPSRFVDYALYELSCAPSIKPSRLSVSFKKDSFSVRLK